MHGRATISPNDFQGSDVERINQAIGVAAGTGRSVVIPRRNHAADGDRDLWLLDSAILVPGPSAQSAPITYESGRDNVRNVRCVNVLGLEEQDAREPQAN